MFRTPPASTFRPSMGREQQHDGSTIQTMPQQQYAVAAPPRQGEEDASYTQAQQMIQHFHARETLLSVIEEDENDLTCASSSPSGQLKKQTAVHCLSSLATIQHAPLPGLAPASRPPLSPQLSCSEAMEMDLGGEDSRGSNDKSTFQTSLNRDGLLTSPHSLTESPEEEDSMFPEQQEDDWGYFYADSSSSSWGLEGLHSSPSLPPSVPRHSTYHGNSSSNKRRSPLNNKRRRAKYPRGRCSNPGATAATAAGSPKFCHH